MGLALAAIGVLVAIGATAAAFATHAAPHFFALEALLGLVLFGIGAAVDHLKDISDALKRAP